jgi:hypothetical protein
MLPALIPLQGEWEAYEERLYDCFCTTLVDNAPFFQGKRISCQFEPASKDKHFCFWHCISEGEIEEARNIDPRRCERIAWIAWMIENAGTDENVVFWRNKRGRNVRIVILHKVERFVTILNEARHTCALVTAYCPSERRMDKLLAEYETQKD